MPDIVRWEEPPAEHGNKGLKKPLKFQAAADSLRARPGHWAVVLEGIPAGTAGGVATRIRRGVGPFAPPKAFEAKAIGPAGGSSSKVYARYVGAEQAS